MASRFELDHLILGNSGKFVRVFVDQVLDSRFRFGAGDDETAGTGNTRSGKENDAGIDCTLEVIAVFGYDVLNSAERGQCS